MPTLSTNSRLALVFSFVLFFLDRFRPSQQNPRLPTIYWNASNPFFSSPSAQTSDTHHFLHQPHLDPPVIPVRFGESIDISCPLFTHDQTQRLEYYTLYQVTKEEFDSCLITKLNNKVTKWIFDCKQPFDINAYTINFVRFSPQPNGLQFEPGQDYYLTSTSTGFADGLQNLDGGVCRAQGMKLIFRVCCSQDEEGDGHVKDDYDDRHRLNEQPRIIRLNDYGEYGGGGGGGEVGAEIDMSSEERQRENDEESRFRNRLTSPVPAPGNKVFPSPKILRVITTKIEDKNLAARPFSRYAPSVLLGIVLSLAVFF